MNYDELKIKYALIDMKVNRLMVEREKFEQQYIKENQPFPLRKYMRITVRLRVSQKHWEGLTDKYQKKKHNQPGYTYSVTGFFVRWLIYDDGELRPQLFDKYYDPADDILSIEAADQIEGHCTKCLKYKDGRCYRNGGKNIGVWLGRKVNEDDYPCPVYEELTELWSADGTKHYPNVTLLKHEKRYRVYNKDFTCFTEYGAEELHRWYRTEDPNVSKS